jgi:hypothetical protein
MSKWLETMTVEKIDNGWLLTIVIDWCGTDTVKAFVRTAEEVIEKVRWALETDAEQTAPDPEPVAA